MEVNNCPGVALLIPCYNGLQHLPALLESAAKVERGFDEIIVYDDASSEALPFDPTERFPDIRFYQGNINRGAGYARNRLMELATSDYIHFHDIDDTEIPVDFLTKLLPHLSSDTVVFSSWQTYWSDASQPKRYDYPTLESVTDFCEYFLRNHVHVNATIFPRELSLKVKFDEDFRVFEDLLFNIRLSQEKIKYRHVNTVVVNHKKNQKSTLGQIKQQKLQEYYAKYCQRCREFLPHQYHKAIGKIALYHAWNSCVQGFDRECDLAIAAARQCGALNYDQFGKIAGIIAPILGINNTFKIRRWWFNRRVKQHLTRSQPLL